ncbi:MAG: O-antigen ligase family protein [Candidatus Andersenbacteria bacterium]|nr:O-antigen ligase family protein [Candidatus Andersenbacteria bacterium]
MSYNSLLLVLAGILPLYIVRFSIFGVPTNAFEVSVLLALCIGVFSINIRRSWVYALKTMPRGMQIAIALLFLSACISAAISHEMRVSFGILKGWFIVPMVFGFLVMSAIKYNSAMKPRILDSLMVSGVVVSVIGMLQIGSMPRIASVYDVPNSLALFIVPLVIIALYRGVLLRNRAYLVSAAIIAIAILATQSVGAIFALIGTGSIGWFAGILPAVFNSKAQRLRVRFLSWVIMAVIFIAFVLSGRIQYLIPPLLHPGATNSATVRLQLWDVGIRLIQKHSILGVGLGQFEPAYQAQLHQLFTQHVPGLQAEYVFRDPHNWIISFWLNLGILGLVSFAYINYKAIRISIKSKNLENRAIALAGISTLLFGLVDTIYWKNDLSVLWWMVMVLAF